MAAASGSAGGAPRPGGSTAADASDAAKPPRGKGTSNFERRQWDREEFELKAQERADREAAGIFDDSTTAGGKREPAPYRDAPVGAAGPEGSRRAYLQARTFELDLESKLGKKRLVTDSTPVAQQGGYWCETCQCTLRDSSAYLDHINGKKHQRRLGFSMRVERSSVDAVKSKLAGLNGGAGGGAARPGSAAARRHVLEAMDPEDRAAMAAMATTAASSTSAHTSAAAIAASAASGSGVHGGGGGAGDADEDNDDDLGYGGMPQAAERDAFGRSARLAHSSVQRAAAGDVSASTFPAMPSAQLAASLEGPRKVPGGFGSEGFVAMAPTSHTHACDDGSNGLGTGSGGGAGDGDDAPPGTARGDGNDTSSALPAYIAPTAHQIVAAAAAVAAAGTAGGTGGVPAGTVGAGVGTARVSRFDAGPRPPPPLLPSGSSALSAGFGAHAGVAVGLAPAAYPATAGVTTTSAADATAAAAAAAAAEAVDEDHGRRRKRPRFDDDDRSPRTQLSISGCVVHAGVGTGVSLKPGLSAHSGGRATLATTVAVAAEDDEAAAMAAMMGFSSFATTAKRR